MSTYDTVNVIVFRANRMMQMYLELMGGKDTRKENKRKKSR